MSAPPDIAHSPAALLSRAWYGASIDEFLSADPHAIIGQLATNCHHHQLVETQTSAWRSQIEFLKQHLTGLSGMLYFEFNIPRMGRRVDTILLLGTHVFVVEFKVGESVFDRAARDQVWDYALDLKNFHEASHTLPIVPILIATEATSRTPALNSCRIDNDLVYQPICVSPGAFRDTIDAVLQQPAGDAIPGPALSASNWAAAPYRPTPTILEAARALYAHHRVEDILRSEAEENVAKTVQTVEAIVQDARSRRAKVICFVTGVPGAGKTLVGLQVATQHRRTDDETHAVFLSGNKPLVDVLTEALTRDECARLRSKGEKKIIKKDVERPVKAFIQLVHHFRDEAVRDLERPPSEHVAIFDEAQRAWNLRKTADFMKRKKNVPDFHQSEPEFLIRYMDRHTDWAVVLCLVGGGQEIHTGEAGIDAWIHAVNNHFSHWEMAISSRLTDTEYSAGRVLDAIRNRPNTRFQEALHLAVSMRSFRAEHVSTFVKAVLDCELQIARDALRQITPQFPICVTRNLDQAKCWIRNHARGSQRYGLVASSKAQRLKPHAVDVRVPVNPVHYFLNGREDTRSSWYLEDAASEFQVQGLELDWVCVTWDGDLRFTAKGWTYHEFPRGDRWTNINKIENQRYLKNAYRVLLTRARQGMVIFVPPGDPSDPTRNSGFYDPTYDYLTKIGVPII